MDSVSDRTISHPEARNAWISYQLRRRGLSYSALARQHGLSVHTPRQALYRPYPRMEKLIAEAIGVRPEEIWPERYPKDPSYLERQRFRRGAKSRRLFREG